MGDRITERTEALALPWFSRPMRIGTVVLAAGFLVPLLSEVPVSRPATAIVVIVTGVVTALATATAIATGLKLVSLVVRVPLSLYVFPD